MDTSPSISFLGLQEQKDYFRNFYPCWNKLFQTHTHTRAHPLRQCHGLFCPITPQQVCNLLSGQHDSPSINRIHSGLPSINMRQSISRGATGDERVCVCLERKGSRLGGKVVLTDHNSRLVPPTHSFVLLKCAVPAYKANQLRNIHRWAYGQPNFLSNCTLYVLALSFCLYSSLSHFLLSVSNSPNALWDRFNQDGDSSLDHHLYVID